MDDITKERSDEFADFCDGQDCVDIDETQNGGQDKEGADSPIENESNNQSIEDAEVAETDSVKEDNSNSKRDEVPTKKSRIDKLPPKLRKAVEYINSHEDVRQMVFFFMFSILCGLSQMIVTYALSAGLKLASTLAGNFDWFVFKFDTTAEFIGFLVGSVVGQVLTFVLNRKKTFNRPDYLVLRAIMYTVMAIIIIIMQTYLGGVVTSACYGAKPDADGFLELVFNLTGQAVAGIAALIVNFLGNKFFVMRDWGKKKREKSNSQSDENTDSLTDGISK